MAQDPHISDYDRILLHMLDDVVEKVREPLWKYATERDALDNYEHAAEKVGAALLKLVKQEDGDA